MTIKRTTTFGDNFFKITIGGRFYNIGKDKHKNWYFAWGLNEEKHITQAIHSKNLVYVFRRSITIFKTSFSRY